ncbi:MAG: hypothetical protein WCC92_21410 [Candidatus Korobacteraceae bacterium]
MSIVDDLRKVLEDFLAPASRAITAQLSAIDSRLNAQDKIAEARHNEVLVRIDSLKTSFEVDKRLENLETRESRA